MTIDKAIFRPFIPLLPAMIGGILLGEKFPGQLLWVFILTLGIIGCLIFWLRKEYPALILPILLFCCAGYLSIQPWVAARFPDHHIRTFADTRKYKITGLISDTPYYYNNRLRFILRAESVVEKGVPLRVCGRIRVTVSGEPIPLNRGVRISFFSRIRSIRNFNNPGGFDYERHMAFKKIWVAASVASERIKILNGAKTSPGLAKIADYRANIANFIDATDFRWAVNTEEIRAVLKALLIGVRSDISKSLRQKFNRAGVGHLLAISGLHIGIVASAAFVICRWVLSFFGSLNLYCRRVK